MSRSQPAPEAGRVETEVDPALLEGGCLLCSEEKPHRCHRRPLAEVLVLIGKRIRIEVVDEGHGTPEPQPLDFEAEEESPAEKKARK